MAITTTIPYYASDLLLPLPSEAEIDAAPIISMEYGGRKIVQVGSQFVVKFGRGVDLAEGENMLFVREHTKVPVPRVYALYSNANKNYIVMERINGQTLLSLWPQLDISEKNCITTTLRSYFDELRNLQSPDYYGSLGGRNLLDGIFWTRKPEPTINGPFTSETALTEERHWH